VAPTYQAFAAIFDAEGFLEEAKSRRVEAFATGLGQGLQPTGKFDRKVPDCDVPQSAHDVLTL
jgi:hypothetical protein